MVGVRPLGGEPLVAVEAVLGADGGGAVGERHLLEQLGEGRRLQLLVQRGLQPAYLRYGEGWDVRRGERGVRRHPPVSVHRHLGVGARRAHRGQRQRAVGGEVAASRESRPCGDGDGLQGVPAVGGRLRQRAHLGGCRPAGHVVGGSHLEDGVPRAVKVVDVGQRVRVHQLGEGLSPGEHPAGAVPRHVRDGVSSALYGVGHGHAVLQVLDVLVEPHAQVGGQYPAPLLLVAVSLPGVQAAVGDAPAASSLALAVVRPLGGYPARGVEAHGGAAVLADDVESLPLGVPSQAGIAYLQVIPQLQLLEGSQGRG